MPLWSFQPLTSTRINVPVNSTATIQYKIISQTSRPHTLSMRPISGITQLVTGAGLCGYAFTLPTKGSSCILSLQINGNQLTAPIIDGPVVCNQGSASQCYRPSAENILRITPAPPLSDASISVSGSPLALITNGSSGQLTITNLSQDISATNITSNFTGTALDGNVIETGNTCNVVAPMASCILTFTPGANVVAQTNFTILGTNTNTIQAAISINPPSPVLASVSPNAGTTSGGTFVTLSGNYLDNSSSVTFGGVSASNITVVNSNTVTANTPPGVVGAVDVTITTPGGQYTLNNGYSYALPPSLTSITPNSGSAAGYTSVTLSGTGFDNATGVIFDNIAAVSFNVIDSNTVAAVTPAHAVGVVDVTITTPIGSDSLPASYTYLATALGQSTSGGIIGCLGGGNQNFIVAAVDNSASLPWGGLGTNIGPAAEDDNNGASNTTAIVNALGAGTGYAAGLCSAYEIDSAGNSPCNTGTCYTSWFLPALNQLICIYNNRAIIGNITSTIYWSSTEQSSNPALGAWALDMSNGGQGGIFKNVGKAVRCIRQL
jgi:hypothetical protein